MPQTASSRSEGVTACQNSRSKAPSFPWSGIRRAIPRLLSVARSTPRFYPRASGRASPGAGAPPWPVSPSSIVHDNPANLKLARVLWLSEGYQVRTALDAEHALETLEEFRPRLIVISARLPAPD